MSTPDLDITGKDIKRIYVNTKLDRNHKRNSPKRKR